MLKDIKTISAGGPSGHRSSISVLLSSDTRFSLTTNYSWWVTRQQLPAADVAKAAVSGYTSKEELSEYTQTHLQRFSYFSSILFLQKAMDDAKGKE